MLLLLWAALATADITPPALRTAEQACDIARCPEGTTETEWCYSTLGKPPECPETAGWERACLEKAGLQAKNLMCKPVEGAPAAPASTEPAPTATAEERWCSTAGPFPAGLGVVAIALIATRRRR